MSSEWSMRGVWYSQSTVEFARVGCANFSKRGLGRLRDHAVAGQLVLDAQLGLGVLELVGKKLVRDRDPPHRERLPQQQAHLLRTQSHASIMRLYTVG